MSRTTDGDESLVERATHDLLNPVASILGLGETIRTRGATLDDATLRSFGESITRQAARLEAAIRDLDRAALLLRTTPLVSKTAVPLADLAGELAGGRVEVDFAADATVSADPTLLVGVLSRLVGNALEHSTEAVTVRGGPGWIEVADRGVGFTEEGIAAAFQPLAAGINAKGERGAGLGLGLFIARRLVEAMGGTITLKSTPGEGSVFRVELPD